MLGTKLTGKKVLSLRIGQPIATVGEPIINPNNLKIEGWFVFDNQKNSNKILLSQDVREILPQGLVVNDIEALTDRTELIRLKTILEHNFDLLGKKVVTSSRKNLGKISDYAFEKESFFIQKLHVNQSIIKSFSGGSLIIDRTQIVEITHKKITVNDATIKNEQAIATATS